MLKLGRSAVMSLPLLAGLLLLLVRSARSAELTFELPDNAQQCFYEEIPSGTKSHVEFQVVTGGNYDVDCEIKAQQKVLGKFVKQQHGEHEFTAGSTGVFSVCFGNEFSSFTHKLVYFEWTVGEEKPLPGVDEHATAMTQMEVFAQLLHENLNSIDEFQTDYRLREASGRKRAEDINERVFYWSIGETLAILCIGLGQVLILKNFFAEKKPLQSVRGPPYTSF